MAHAGEVARTGLGQVAERRVRANAGRLAAAWVVLVAAIGLVASGVQYADAVAFASLQRALLDAPAASRGTSVVLSAAPSAAAGLDAAVRPVVDTAVGSAASVFLAARSSSLALVGGGSASRPLVVLGGYEALTGHARLTSGRWPAGGQTPVEAVVSDGALEALGLQVGDTVQLADAATPGAGDTPLLTVVITGAWAADPADPYWLGDALDLSGTAMLNGSRFAGPLMVAPADLLDRRLVPGLVLTWRAGIAADSLAPDQVPALEAGIRSLPDAVASALPPATPAQVDTSVADVLARADRSLANARAGITLLLVQFVVLAGFAVFQLAGLLDERRRRQDQLLEARGATGRALLTVAVLEALLLVVPAMLVAPLVAAAGVAALTGAGPLGDAGITLPLAPSGSALIATLAAGLIAVAILASPAVPSGERVAAVRLSLGRDLGRFRGRRVAPDLALLLIAGIALWQFRTVGAAQDATSATAGTAALPAAGGVQPILVVGPAVALLAAALLVTRLLPRLAGLLERADGPRRRTAARLAVVELARRPQRATQAALLVVLAAGLATFALTQAATWYGSQSDQAAYQAASSLRAVTPAYPAIPDDRRGAAYLAIPGVAGAIPVIRTPLTVGGAVRTADLLAFDARAGASLASLPGGPRGSLAAALTRLAAARPTVAAIDLPAGARSLAVTVDTALNGRILLDAGQPSGLVDPTTPVIRIEAVVIDEDGLLWRYASSSEAAFKGSGQRLVIPLSTPLTGTSAADSTGPAAPARLRLEALDVIVDEPDWPVVVDGSIDLRSVQAGASSDASGQLASVPFAPSGPGWQWLRIDPSGSLVYTAPAAQPGRILAGTGGWKTVSGSVPTAWRAWAEPAGSAGSVGGEGGGGGAEVGAVASASLLTATGQNPGDSFTGTVGGVPLTLRAESVADAMPPLDPRRPFVVVDAPTMSLALLAADGTQAAPAEWWLATTPGSEAEVAAAVAAPPFGATVIARDAIERSLQADPVALGVVGALSLGAVAAILLGIAGFAVALGATLDARFEEMGLVRAIGVSDRQLRLGLVAEEAVVLLAGTLAGIALGVATAWLVLPVAMLTPDGSRPVPEPVLVVPWQLITAVAAGSVLLLALAAFAVGRRVRGIDTAAALRGGAG